MSNIKVFILSFTLLLLQINARYILVTDHVYFDIEIDDKPVGRMVFGLFGKFVPKTVENFKTLASQGINGMRYGGTLFHRVIKRFMIQGGDVINYDGSGSISIFGSTFDDENFEINHTASGFLSMSNSGPNSNGCQFFIITRPTPWLDGKHTVFGKIVDGQSILHKIEHIETDGKDRPLKPVVITQSGIEKFLDAYEISDEDYGLWQWFRASLVPLSWSFTILGFFHWVMNKLDTQL